MESSAITHEWLSYMSGHLIFGLPATALLFLVLGLMLRRTKRLYDEADRREAAEGALRQAQRLEAIGQLTGGVAHDFNNLLMIISGSVQRLRGELTDSKQTRLLDMIATATQRGETLTRQLLTYSRQQTLTPQVIDLTQRLPLIRELLTRSLHGNIEIKVDVPDGPCAVRVDPGEFELAILNLAVNAKDAMPQGGSLTIRAKPVTLRGEASDEGLSGEFVAVRVADTGQGIPSEVLTRVFEPFFTTKEFGKGTGLGLSQVYGFAKQSGGTATVSSTDGRGTAVTLYLPRSHDKPEPVVADVADARAGQGGRHRAAGRGQWRRRRSRRRPAAPARLPRAQRRQCAGGDRRAAARSGGRSRLLRHPDAGRQERARSRRRDRASAIPTSRCCSPPATAPARRTPSPAAWWCCRSPTISRVCAATSARRSKAATAASRADQVGREID